MKTYTLSNVDVLSDRFYVNVTVAMKLEWKIDVEGMSEEDAGKKK